MDGIHDLGGMQGLGPVAHAPAEPVFHDRWEAVARALMEVVAGAVGASGGEFRHAIERMEPGHYLMSSYYEHWLTAAATLAVEHGLVTHSELEARAGGRFPLSGPALAPPVAAVVDHAFGGDREPFRRQLIKAIAAEPGRPYWESWTTALEALVATLPEQPTS